MAELSAHERDVAERPSRTEVQMLGARARGQEGPAPRAGGPGSQITSRGVCHPRSPRDRAEAAVQTSSRAGWVVRAYGSFCLPFLSLWVTRGSKLETGRGTLTFPIWLSHQCSVSARFPGSEDTCLWSRLHQPLSCSQRFPEHPTGSLASITK